MNFVQLKLNNNLKYQDLILFAEDMKLIKNNFSQIPTQNKGEIYFEY